MTRVIVADDHPVVRIGALFLLQRIEGIDIVGEARSSSELVPMLETTGCDVLLTDFSMPEGAFGDGLQMLERLRRRHPGLAIVVLTMASHPQVLRAMLALGCKGICDKRAPLSDCVKAIQAIAQGRTFQSDSVAQAVSAADVGADDGLALTPREIEVVRLLAEGYSVDHIANQLHRSPKTISSQKRAAMRRLGIGSDDALLAYAYESGLAWR